MATTSRANHFPSMDPDPTRVDVARRHAIVVGVDVDSYGAARSQAAAGWAASEAERTGRRLVLVCATRDVRGRLVERSARFGGGLRGGRAARRVDAIASDLHAWHPRVPVSAVVKPGKAASVLLEASEHAELIVLGKRTLGGLTRVLVHSTSIAAAGRSDVPVVVVPDAWDQAAHDEDSILVGVDVTRPDGLALQAAFLRAHQLAVPLTAVYAWGGGSSDVTAKEHDQRSHEALSALERAVEPWSRRYPGVDVDILQRQGSPALALLGLCVGAQAVVVGRHAPDAEPGFLFGSVAKAVLHYADCPVVVIPTERRS